MRFAQARRVKVKEVDGGVISGGKMEVDGVRGCVSGKGARKYGVRL